MTTVAAAYAMVANATDPTHVSSSNSSRRLASRSATLANVATGFTNSRPDSHVPRAKIHTFANILSACINSRIL